MRARHAWLPLLVLLLLVPTAGAQTFLDPGTAQFEVPPDENAEIPFTLRNPVNRSFFAFARVDGDLSDTSTITPHEFTVGPSNTRTLTLSVSPDNMTAGEHTGRLHLSLIDRETGTTHTHTANLSGTLTAPLLFLDEWKTPLPAPLDGVIGLFLLETLTWAAISGLAVGLVKLGIHHGTRSLTQRTQNQVRSQLDVPAFAVLFIGGVRYSWRFFSPQGITGFIGDALTALWIAAGALFFYRAMDAVLVYYGEQIAPHTETRWDDIAVPVLRKVTVALLGGFVILYALQKLGLDLGFLVAGGVVIGLVLSSSLGPTLANLFSGLFILMDRPFREGDDIRLDTGEVCRVEQIGLRSTRLYFYRNHEMIIAPNQQLENSRIVNLAYPDRRYRMHLPVSVAYGSPLDEVREILVTTAKEHPEVLVDPDSEPRVFFDDFGDNGLMFRVSFYVMEVGERFRIASEIRNTIDASFREAGITIPFPQRTLWQGNIGDLLEEGRQQAGEPLEPSDTDASRSRDEDAE